MKMIEKFAIGDTVTWSSSSGTEPKTGVVLSIIPEGMRLVDPNGELDLEVKKDLKQRGILFDTQFLSGGSARKTESYLVGVSQRGRKTVFLYWPQTQWLSK